MTVPCHGEVRLGNGAHSFGLGVPRVARTGVMAESGKEDSGVFPERPPPLLRDGMEERGTSVWGAEQASMCGSPVPGSRVPVLHPAQALPTADPRRTLPARAARRERFHFTLGWHFRRDGRVTIGGSEPFSDVSKGSMNCA